MMQRQRLRHLLAACDIYACVCVCGEREKLLALIKRKDESESHAFEQRYDLAIQKAARIQLERVLRDATYAVSRLVDVRTALCRSQCSRREDVFNVFFLQILKHSDDFYRFTFFEVTYQRPSILKIG